MVTPERLEYRENCAPRMTHPDEPDGNEQPYASLNQKLNEEDKRGSTHPRKVYEDFPCQRTTFLVVRVFGQEHSSALQQL